jgi:hypothetical protein
MKVSHDVPSMHISSEVIWPNSGSPSAPPAVAVPCQFSGVDARVIVPAAGFDACTVGELMNAELKPARMASNTIRTPRDFTGRAEMTPANIDLVSAALWCDGLEDFRRLFLGAFNFIWCDSFKIGRQEIDNYDPT